jgi:photosystem II stability/assembly factor-like uncharacterized protein
MLVGREFFDGVAAISNDWGSTWSSTIFSSTALSDVASWTSVSKITYYVAVAVTGDVFYTNNSGITWYYAPSPVEVSLFGVAVGSNGQAFAVGAAGKIYSSSNSSSFSVWSDISQNYTTSQLNGVSTLDGVVGKLSLYMF